MGNIHNDVIKQNGVASVGTLYRKCMGRVVVHRVKLYTNKKSPDEYNIMCYEPKRILLRIFKSPCGRFLASAHLKIEMEKPTRTRTNSLLLINKMA